MRRTIVLLSLLLVAAPARAADLMIRERVTGSGPGVQAHEETRYLTATRQINDGPHDRTMVDFEGKTMTWVDKDRKSYVVMTFDEMRRQNERTQERLKEVPDIARQMMGMDAPVKFTATGKSETIAGYATKEYRVEGGLTTGSVWVAADLDPPAATGELQRFAAAAGARSGPGGRLAEAMAQLGGLPLRSSLTTAMGPVRISLDTETLEVRRESPPPDLLKAPDGYTTVIAPQADDD